MHDIKFIRDNKDAFDEAMACAVAYPKQSHAILEADMQKRETLTRLQELQSHRNQLARPGNRQAEKSRGKYRYAYGRVPHGQ